MYRIRSRELVRRLSQEALGVDASGKVFAYGTSMEVADSRRKKRREPEHKKVTSKRRDVV